MCIAIVSSSFLQALFVAKAPNSFSKPRAFEATRIQSHEISCSMIMSDNLLIGLWPVVPPYLAQILKVKLNPMKSFFFISTFSF